METTTPDNSRHPIVKNITIRVITLSLPLLFLLLVEGILRLFSAGDDLSLFIPHPREGYESYMIVNPEVGKKYFSRLEYDAPSSDIFLKEKPRGAFRVFVLGSSTVVGFPYEENLMFSRILHHRLEEAYPGTRIEVVNTAITAINSHTLLDFASQVRKYQPDAVLVYAGHNEFYGAFGVGSAEGMSRSRGITRAHLRMMDFRFYQLLRKLVTRPSGRGEKDGKGETLMKRIVADASIPLESDAYGKAMDHYRQNMAALTGEFTRRGIPVFLSEVVSNVRDLAPLSYLSTREEGPAILTFRKATGVLGSGDTLEAATLFGEARDLDGIRFRATAYVNRILEELAKAPGVRLVPMKDRFSAHSSGGIIGGELITEHVHPNTEGILLMADAFYRALTGAGMPAENPREGTPDLEWYRRHWGMTALDSLLAKHRVANLTSRWPFRPAGEGGSDYRLTYRPRSRTDSLAFDIFRDPTLFLDEVRLDLAQQYSRNGNHEAAYREYEALLRTNPYVAVNYRDAATELLILQDLPRAFRYLERSLRYEPSFYARYRMGEILMIRGDYPGARRQFEAAFSLTGDRDERIKTLGKLYQACRYAGQDADAETLAGQLRSYDAEQFLKIPPRQYTFDRYIPFQTRDRVVEARKLLEEGEATEAISLLEGSLEIYDSHAARLSLAKALTAAGDTLQAIGQMKRIRKEYAFDPIFRYELGSLCLETGRMAEAKSELEALRDLEPRGLRVTALEQRIALAEKSDP